MSRKPESEDLWKERVFVDLWPRSPSGIPHPHSQGLFLRGAPQGGRWASQGSSACPVATKWFRDWARAWCRDSGTEKCLLQVCPVSPWLGRTTAIFLQTPAQGHVCGTPNGGLEMHDKAKKERNNILGTLS